MTMDIRVYGTPAITHRQTCALHDDEKTTVCSGTLRKGGNCVNKATDTSLSRMMPTCKIHRDQLRISGRCQAQLPCGFECGRLFEWKPHGFPLCPRHREYLTTCHFLNTSKEMRLRVYQLLLPDRRIPVRYANSNGLTTGGGGVYTAILCVNRQIHDEATDFLYSSRVFTVELSGNGLSMCNSVHTFARCRFPFNGNHALQDYQVQLMLLEQQSKKRLLMARQEQDSTSRYPNSTHSPATRDIQRPARSPIPYTHGPFETLWHPPLCSRYFNMIQSFLIEFVFPPPVGSNPVINRVPGTSNTDVAMQKNLELWLYDYCDHLHKLIGRLQLIQRPLARLEIIIHFGGNYKTREEAFGAAQFLLRPFRRLYCVARPRVLSITVDDFQGRGTELLTTDWTSCEADMIFADYLKCWSRDLSGSEPSFKCPEVFVAYWKLEKLLFSIREHCFYAEPKFDQFTDWLHAARIAREANDLVGFKEIWDHVVNTWCDYLNNQKEFQSNVARSIDTIYDIVGTGSLAGSSGDAVCS